MSSSKDYSEKLVVPTDLQDEISRSLHDFRKQRYPNLFGRRGMTRTVKKAQEVYRGYFSDVRYRPGNAGDSRGGEHPSIEANYLFDSVYNCRFRISFVLSADNNSHNTSDQIGRKPSLFSTQVVYVGCERKRSGSGAETKEWERPLMDLCDKLNQRDEAQANKSVYAVLSNLLQSLDRYQTQYLRKLHDSMQMTHTRNSTSRNLRGKQLTLVNEMRSNHQATTDLGIVLLRCAAIGKHRNVFLHPLPPSFWASNFRAGDGNKSSCQANALWKATEEYPMRSITTASTSDPSVLISRQRELVGFVQSLTWVQDGTISVKEHRTTSGMPRTISVCLDLYNNDGYEAALSYAPRFARLSQEYGVHTAYHGTHMDHVWSILNNGFWNMSEIGKGEFVKNGAMLGSGVYLSTSRKVATFFATNASAQSATAAALLQTALKHKALSSLQQSELETTNSRTLTPSSSRKEKQGLDIHKQYHVSCFPVFEARIIRPPCSVKNKRLQEGTKRTIEGLEDYQPTRKEDKYYVVPDGKDVMITHLHLTFELKQRRSPSFRWNDILWIIALAILVAAFVIK